MFMFFKSDKFSLKGCLKIPILSRHAKPMQMICDQLMYWFSMKTNTHTHAVYTPRSSYFTLQDLQDKGSKNSEVLLLA